MKILAIRFLGVLIILNFLVCGSACVRTNLSPIPQPPATAKLRIFVLAVTSEDASIKRPVRLQWSPEKLNAHLAEKINEHLKIQGIYEVVPSEDIKTVLGNQTVTSGKWMAGDWALAKNVGRALHADYAWLIERHIGASMQFNAVLINLNTGKLFQSSNYIPWVLMSRFNDDEKMQACGAAMLKNFHQISSDSRKDLLNTAMVKGKLLPEKVQVQVSEMTPVVGTETTDKSKEETLPQPKTITSSRDKEPIGDTGIKSKEKQIAFEKELEETIFVKNKKQEGTRLIVYDFDAVERLRIVGLILAESLREELLKLGGFVLVNRENMIQVIEEYKLQHSGLVDEKQSIKIGQWLAANEAVTGMLAPLGDTSILQAKLIDIKKMSTIALGSLKCPAGHEDELLNNMPLLAHKLVQSQK